MDVLQDSELFQAQSHLYKHIFNYISSMSMKCAVELGIPDIIHSHGQPITLPDLVSALEIHPSKTSFVHRLMCLLVHSGFFSETRLAVKHHTNQQDGDQEEEEEAYDLTPSSRLLLKSKLPCLLPFVLSMLDPAMVTPWHFLGDWFRGNRGSSSTPFEVAHNMSIWEYGNQNPEFGNLFNEAMASDSGIMNLVIRDYKPVFEGLVTLVDVGGGTGQLGRIITEFIPHLKCTVLDLPHVVANSPVVETENLKFIGGDMFQSIPPADAVMLKWILHSWSDEKCLEILKKCRGAIPSDRGKVIIIDMVINRDKEEHQLTEVKLFFDMLMMAMTTGRERSEKDWEKLFLEAGFMSYKTTPIFGLRSLIEVFP